MSAPYYAPRHEYDYAASMAGDRGVCACGSRVESPRDDDRILCAASRRQIGLL